MSAYHVRPKRSAPYGKGDGSDYDNAWGGLKAVQWSRAGGNSLMVSGLHDHTGDRTAGLVIPVSNVRIESNPADPAVLRRHHVLLPDQHDVTLVGLSLVEGGQVRGDRAQRITLSYCTLSRLSPAAIVFVELGEGNDSWWLDGCTIEHAGNAVYARSRPTSTKPANNLLVTNCTLRHLGAGAKDGHGVGVQGGSGHRVIDCNVYDCGTAIEFWWGAEQIGRDCVASGNKIRDCRALPVADGSGIKFSGSYDVTRGLPKVGWRTGMMATYNDIADCAGWGISANIRDPLEEYGNKVERCGLGVRRVKNPFG